MKMKDIRNAYRQALPAGELRMFREDEIDRVHIPVVAASLVLPDGSQFGTHGYGLTQEEAEVSALGEMTEFVYSELVLRTLPRVQGTYEELVRERGVRAVADPLTMCLQAGSDYHPGMPLTWVEVTRLTTGEKVLVPEEWVATSPSLLEGRTSHLITPITNGQGAGLSREQAVAHGLLELMQRDGNGLQFRALDQGVVLDLKGAPLNEDIQELLAHYEGLGIEIMAKLASTDFGFVNVYVVGRDPSPGKQPLVLSSCGEAADPDRDRALRKALIEYASSRTRKAFANGPLDEVERVAPPGYLQDFLSHVKLESEEKRALHAMAWFAQLPTAEMRALMERTVLTERRRVPFTQLPTAPEVTDTRRRYDTLVERISQAGLDILVADLSPEDPASHSVKVIVPGMEVETMSYHRIGERGVAKLLAREDPLAGLGKPPEGAARVRLTAEAEARLGGPAWFNRKLADQRLGNLYALYREPERHAAQLLLRQRRFGGGLS
ncbi:MAG: YcaO-like family protein [Cystobacter sp.]